MEMSECDRKREETKMEERIYEKGKLLRHATGFQFNFVDYSVARHCLSNFVSAHIFIKSFRQKKVYIFAEDNDSFCMSRNAASAILPKLTPEISPKKL